jgi:thymidylate synthase (FAD)
MRVSRCCSHQLVRHRLAAYSQRSQRFVNEDGNYIVYPHTIQNNPKALSEYEQAIFTSKQAYNKMIELGIPLEDARYILPGGSDTSILVTWNARTLLHIFRLRLWDDHAQWEIMEMMKEIFDLVSSDSPEVFNAGNK